MSKACKFVTTRRTLAPLNKAQTMTTGEFRQISESTRAATRDEQRELFHAELSG